MKRLLDGTCRRFERVAVVANDALGNYVVSTPLIQAIRREYRPKHLHFYSGSRTQELWSEDPNIDCGFAVLGGEWRVTADHALRTGPYDLIVNMESSCWAYALTSMLAGHESFVVGPCLGPGARGMLTFADDEAGRLAQDRSWIDPNLTSRYSILKTGFIGEIFCRLAHIQGAIPAYSVPRKTPSQDVPPVLIATSASLEEKLWPQSSWIEVLAALQSEGFEVGLLGAKPAAQREFWKGDDLEGVLVEMKLVHDLRGALTLPEVVGAIEQARAILTLDNGILHLAAATHTPTVGLFREGIHRLWAPPVSSLTALTPAFGEPVSQISPARAWEALRLVL